MAGKVNIRKIQLRGQFIQRGQITLEETEHPDDQQSRARVEVHVVGVEHPDQVLDLLVRDDPADEEDIGPLVVKLIGDETIGDPIEVSEVRNDGQHRGAGKSQRFEVLAVELRIPQSKIAAIDVRLKLATPSKALSRERPVDADEILRRRDVVIDERHPVRQRVRGSRSLAAN